MENANMKRNWNNQTYTIYQIKSWEATEWEEREKTNERIFSFSTTCSMSA